MNQYELLTFVVLTKMASLVLGGLITVLAFRASRRRASSPMWLFALGVGLVTLAIGLVGGVDLVVDGVVIQARSSKVW
ncbi:hypothetical protein SAMN04487948_1149 [Halogranum amylolyticum]|uniref:Uncharacterized protein n=1 Tax=Halogranum amylolyticum TaxID=660520 RepID=A0A1H8V3H1_9EURY|nr:hypothetical protein [Halogranum amylolyticum]SEP09979.1 hypothetical protein SAMN04487948_1149 [Halogranum amylolyticum]